MLLKTKLLISLSALGIAGGTGTGIYFLKNKSEDQNEGSSEIGRANSLGDSVLPQGTSVPTGTGDSGQQGNSAEQRIAGLAVPDGDTGTEASRTPPSPPSLLTSTNPS